MFLISCFLQLIIFIILYCSFIATLDKSLVEEAGGESILMGIVWVLRLLIAVVCGAASIGYFLIIPILLTGIVLYYFYYGLKCLTDLVIKNFKNFKITINND